LRAVFDPNVLIAALLSPRGTPAKLLLAWRAGTFELVVSSKLIAELEHVFAYPKIRKRIGEQEAEEFIDLLRRTVLIAEDPSGPPSSQSSDPGDDYLFALAEAESAALVSGDSHVLQVSGRLPIYSPREYLGLFED
jgi:uncharacterized protein